MAKVKEAQSTDSMESVQSENSNLKEVEVVIVSESKGYINENDVTFEVKYSDSYKGKKTMPEGKVVISKESAELFTSRGIGKIVK